MADKTSESVGLTAVHGRFCRWVAASGATLTEIGARIGCDASYVARIRRGDRTPGRAIANAIERESSTWSEGPILASEWDEADDHGSSLTATELAGEAC